MPRPGVGEHLDDVDEPAARAVEAVLALAGAVQAAQDRDLGEPAARARRRRCRSRSRPRPPGAACSRAPPPKITSCIDCPRTASGDCSPMAQSTASVTFDFPDPLGPTITLTRRAPNSSRVRSGNDLKPLSVIDFRCIELALTRPPRASSSAAARGRLLGVLLATARCPRRRPTRRTCAATAKCGRAAGPPPPSTTYATTSPRRASSSCSADLKSTGRSIASSISGTNASTTAGAVRLEPELQVARPDDRLDHRRQHPLGAHQRVARSARRRPGAAAHRSRSGTPSRSATARHARPETACARTFVSRPAPKRSASRRGYRWVVTASDEHRVAQEGQPLVGVGAPLGPRGMREHLPRRAPPAGVQQVGERRQGSGPRLGGWCARTKSTACPTVRISRRLLVGDRDPVGVLELLHQRVQVERVRLQVLLEAACPPRSRAGSMSSSSARWSRMSSKTSSRVIGGPLIPHASRTLGRAPRSAPAASSASCVRSTACSRTARAATSIALRKAAAGEPPVRHHPDPAQPEQVRPARALGVDLVAQLHAARGAAAARRPWPGRRHGLVADRAHEHRRDALHQLQRDVAGEAVGDDDVGGARITLVPSTLPTKSTGATVELSWAATTSGVPLLGSSPLESRRHPRRADTEHRRGEGRAHEGELDEVIGPRLHVGAHVEQQSRARPGWAWAARAPAGGCPARA